MVTNPGDMGNLETQIEQAFGEATARHPWLVALTEGAPPETFDLDPAEVLAGLGAPTAITIDAIKLLAAEVDRHDASR